MRTSVKPPVNITQVNERIGSGILFRVELTLGYLFILFGPSQPNKEEQIFKDGSSSAVVLSISHFIYNKI